MEVAVYYNNKDVRLEKRPRPSIGRGEILLKVASSGICGSDVMEWYRIKSAPRILGHEVAGIIEEVGEGVEGYEKGDRIFVTHHVPCNTCRFCLKGEHTACKTLHTTNFDPGGFAEYLRIPEINVLNGTFKLPDSVSLDAGVFIEPLGCVIRGQRKARVDPGDTVLIVGSGLSGLLHLRLALARGAARVICTDVDEFRLRTAKSYGADAVIDAREDVPANLRELNEGRLADRVILCTGALPAVEQAFRSVEPGGTILIFAVPRPDQKVEVPLNPFWKDQVTITTSYAAAPRDLFEAIDLIASGRVKVEDMVTHALPLSKAQEGFSLTAEPKESLKVVLKPHGDLA